MNKATMTVQSNESGAPPVALPAAMRAVSVRVEAAMQEELEDHLAASDPLLREIVQYALFGGGKRVRPFLAVTCARCLGRDDADLYRLAAALEYLHSATLMHDDVIDHAPLRRGRETAASRYSIEDAILAGDWLHARSLYLVGKFTGEPGLDVFCQATEGMANGEFVQKRLAGDCATSEADYLGVIRLKTGNLMASSCALGAIYAGADRERAARFHRFGERLGMAFQIVDDLLDYTGTPETGKEPGNDFREGKLTLPLLRALAAADAKKRAAMRALVEGERNAAGAAAAMTALIGELDGFRSAAATARAYVDEALEELAPLAVLPTAEPHVGLLRDLAGYILARNR